MIYNCNSVYGRLLSYMFMLNRQLSMFLHIHSPALLHYLCFCSSAFTSCLVCESTGLHLILAMEMCVVQHPEDVKITYFTFRFMRVFFVKELKVNVFNISP